EAPVTVLIGNTSASGKMVYVKNQNQDAVAIVRQTEAEQLLLPPIAYRDRTVVRIPREQVRKIEVTRADGPAVTVSRDSAVAPWQMTAPVTAAADADATRNLLSDLAALRAKRVV